MALNPIFRTLGLKPLRIIIPIQILRSAWSSMTIMTLGNPGLENKVYQDQVAVGRMFQSIWKGVEMIPGDPGLVIRDTKGRASREVEWRLTES
jgi:hypothetical protein